MATYPCAAAAVDTGSKNSDSLKFVADPHLYSSFQAIPLDHPFLRWNMERVFSPIFEFTYPADATLATQLPPQVFGDKLLLRSLGALPVADVTEAATKFSVGRVPGHEQRRLVSLLEFANSLGLESDREYTGFESTFSHYKQKNLQQVRMAFNLRRVVDPDEAPPVKERNFVVMPLWEYEDAAKIYRAARPSAPLPSSREIYKHDEGATLHALTPASELVRVKRDDPHGRVCISLMFNADMLLFEFSPEGELRFKTCTNPAFRVNREIQKSMESILEGLCDALEGKRSDLLLNYDQSTSQVATTEELIRVLLPASYKLLSVEQHVAAAKCRPEDFLPTDDPTSMLVQKYDYEMVKNNCDLMGGGAS